MEKYKILDGDIDTGLHIVKILSGKHNGLLLSLYNVGCDDSKLFYNFSVLNEREDTDLDSLDVVLKDIMNDLYFKEC